MLESRLKTSNASGGGSFASGEDETELAAQIQDLDFTEALLKERQNDLQEIRRYAHEINLTAQFQAHKIHEASNDIEVIENDTAFAEKKVEEADGHLSKALEHQNKTSKKNLIVCFIAVLICAVTLAIVISNHSSN